MATFTNTLPDALPSILSEKAYKLTKESHTSKQTPIRISSCWQRKVWRITYDNSRDETRGNLEWLISSFQGSEQAGIRPVVINIL